MLLYYFKLDVSSIASAQETLDRVVYSNTEHVFNREIFCASTPGGCFTFLSTKQIKFEATPGGEITTHVFQTDDDIIDALKSHFPSLPDDDVINAVRNWRANKDAFQKEKKETS